MTARSVRKQDGSQRRESTMDGELRESVHRHVVVLGPVSQKAKHRRCGPKW
ncbi:hypothetical protein CGMCC3_g6283 [Colletotrichum fructicola]|nr:uncharacterized protein CGMCC3_g6283 [Colletotrichum fructicola]KAE9577715.1 hypothetical protein CGMCC3_g6283 [Colletotrichum fructicola]